MFIIIIAAGIMYGAISAYSIYSSINGGSIEEMGISDD